MLQNYCGQERSFHDAISSSTVDSEWNNVVNLFFELRDLLDNCNKEAQHSWAIIDKVQRSASIITLELEDLEREISDQSVDSEPDTIGIEPYCDHLLNSLYLKKEQVSVETQVETWNKESILQKIKCPIYMTPQLEQFAAYFTQNNVICTNIQSLIQNAVTVEVIPEPYIRRFYSLDENFIQMYSLSRYDVINPTCSRSIDCLESLLNRCVITELDDCYELECYNALAYKSEDDARCEVPVQKTKLIKYCEFSDIRLIDGTERVAGRLKTESPEPSVDRDKSEVRFIASVKPNDEKGRRKASKAKEPRERVKTPAIEQPKATTKHQKPVPIPVVKPPIPVAKQPMPVAKRLDKQPTPAAKQPMPVAKQPKPVTPPSKTTISDKPSPKPPSPRSKVYARKPPFANPPKKPRKVPKAKTSIEITSDLSAEEVKEEEIEEKREESEEEVEELQDEEVDECEKYYRDSYDSRDLPECDSEMYTSKPRRVSPNGARVVTFDCDQPFVHNRNRMDDCDDRIVDCYDHGRAVCDERYYDDRVYQCDDQAVDYDDQMIDCDDILGYDSPVEEVDNRIYKRSIDKQDFNRSVKQDINRNVDERGYSRSVKQDINRSVDERGYSRSPKQDLNQSVDERGYSRSPKQDFNQSVDERGYSRSPKQDFNQSVDERGYSRSPKQDFNQSVDERGYSHSDEQDFIESVDEQIFSQNVEERNLDVDERIVDRGDQIITLGEQSRQLVKKESIPPEKSYLGQKGDYEPIGREPSLSQYRKSSEFGQTINISGQKIVTDSPQNYRIVVGSNVKYSPTKQNETKQKSNYDRTQGLVVCDVKAKVQPTSEELSKGIQTEDVKKKLQNQETSTKKGNMITTSTQYDVIPEITTETKLVTFPSRRESKNQETNTISTNPSYHSYLALADKKHNVCQIKRIRFKSKSTQLTPEDILYFKRLKKMLKKSQTSVMSSSLKNFFSKFVNKNILSMNLELDKLTHLEIKNAKKLFTNMISFLRKSDVENADIRLEDLPTMSLNLDPNDSILEAKSDENISKLEFNENLKENLNEALGNHLKPNLDDIQNEEKLPPNIENSPSTSQNPSEPKISPKNDLLIYRPKNSKNELFLKCSESKRKILKKYFQKCKSQGMPVTIEKLFRDLKRKTKVKFKRKDDFSFRKYISRQQASCEKEIVNILKKLNDDEHLKEDSQIWLTKCHHKLLVSLEQLYSNDFSTDKKRKSQFSQQAKALLKKLKEKQALKDGNKSEEMSQKTSKAEKPQTSKKINISLKKKQNLAPKPSISRPTTKKLQTSRPISKANSEKLKKTETSKVLESKKLSSNMDKLVCLRQSISRQNSEAENLQTSNSETKSEIVQTSRPNTKSDSFQTSWPNSDSKSGSLANEVKPTSRPSKVKNENLQRQREGKLHLETLRPNSDTESEVLRSNSEVKRKNLETSNKRKNLLTSNHSEVKTSRPNSEVKSANLLTSKPNIEPLRPNSKARSQISQTSRPNSKPKNEILPTKPKSINEPMKISRPSLEKLGIPILGNKPSFLRPNEEKPTTSRPNSKTCESQNLRPKSVKLQTTRPKSTNKIVQVSIPSLKQSKPSKNEKLQIPRNKKSDEKISKQEFELNVDLNDFNKLSNVMDVLDVDVYKNPQNIFKTLSQSSNVKKEESNSKESGYNESFEKSEKTEADVKNPLKKFSSKNIVSGYKKGKKRLKKTDKKSFENKIAEIRKTQRNYLEEIDNALKNCQKPSRNKICDFETLCDIHEKEKIFKKKDFNATKEKLKECIRGQDMKIGRSRSYENLKKEKEDIKRFVSQESYKMILIQKCESKDIQSVSRFKPPDYKKDEKCSISFFSSESYSISYKPSEKISVKDYERNSEVKNISKFQREIRDLKRDIERKIEMEKSEGFRSSLDSIEFWKSLEKSSKKTERNTDFSVYTNLTGNMVSELCFDDEKNKTKNLINKWEKKGEYDIYPEAVSKWLKTPSIEEMERQKKEKIKKKREKKKSSNYTPTRPLYSHPSSELLSTKTYKKESPKGDFRNIKLVPKFNDVLQKNYKTKLKKSTVESFLKALQEYWSVLDESLCLYNMALKKDNLKSISKFYSKTKHEYCKERSMLLYKHLVSVDKSRKRMCGDFDGSSPKAMSLPTKYDKDMKKVDSKHKVNKTTLEYVKNELVTLKSQINRGLFAEIRNEIANSSMNESELKKIIQSIDSELDKIKSSEKQIDLLIQDIKQRIELEGDLDDLQTRFEKDFVSKFEYECSKISQDEALKKLKQEAITETKNQLNEKLTEINDLIQLQIQEQSRQEKERNNSEISLRKKLEHIGDVLQTELNNIQSVLSGCQNEPENEKKDAKSKEYNRRRNMFEKSFSNEEKDEKNIKETSPKGKGSVVKAKQSLEEKMNEDLKDKYLKKK